MSEERRPLPEWVLDDDYDNTLTAVLGRKLIHAAQDGKFFRYRDWAHHLIVEEGLGTSAESISGAVTILRGWGLEVTRERGGNHQKPWTPTTLSGVPIVDYERVSDSEFPDITAPEEWKIPYSEARIRSQRSQRKNTTISLPPLGFDLTITKAEITDTGMAVVLQNKWRANAPVSTIEVGGSLQVLAAGLGKGGVWIETTSGQMTLK